MLQVLEEGEGEAVEAQITHDIGAPHTRRQGAHEQRASAGGCLASGAIATSGAGIGWAEAAEESVMARGDTRLRMSHPRRHNVPEDATCHGVEFKLKGWAEDERAI